MREGGVYTPKLTSAIASLLQRAAAGECGASGHGIAISACETPWTNALDLFWPPVNNQKHKYRVQSEVVSAGAKAKKSVHALDAQLAQTKAEVMRRRAVVHDTMD